MSEPTLETLELQRLYRLRMSALKRAAEAMERLGFKIRITITPAVMAGTEMERNA